MENVTLKAQIEATRLEAREQLRKEMIATQMEEISRINLDNSRFEKAIEENKKDIENGLLEIKGEEYDMDNLDKKHPLYERKLENMSKYLESKKKTREESEKFYNSNIEDNKKTIENNLKRIEKLEEKIEKIQSGEILMSLEKINQRTKELLNK